MFFANVSIYLLILVIFTNIGKILQTTLLQR